MKKIDKFTKTVTDMSDFRTLFTRAIMHELKTPIGKGRIIAEMVENDLNRERLIKVFRRLDDLVDEFAKIERLAATNYEINMKRCSVKEILDASFDILMINTDQLKKKVSVKLPARNVYINADLDFMPLAFKNLIDNAIKYGSEGHVAITLERGVLSFCNKGEASDKLFAKSREPFIHSDKKDKALGGMGLGLYVADNIFKIHGLKLDYEYKDSFHRFFINLTAS
ncbi:MAG: HAMP domain-containing histidine kinase [Campylobacteraceae bacterium]|nr:HAMP domain-containing histidine kinase [Campylobacteraceae bacterium]